MPAAASWRCSRPTGETCRRTGGHRLRPHQRRSCSTTTPGPSSSRRTVGAAGPRGRRRAALGAAAPASRSAPHRRRGPDVLPRVDATPAGRTGRARQAAPPPPGSRPRSPAAPDAPPRPGRRRPAVAAGLPTRSRRRYRADEWVGARGRTRRRQARPVAGGAAAPAAARRLTVLDAVEHAGPADWLPAVQQALVRRDSVVITHVDALDARGAAGAGRAAAGGRPGAAGLRTAWVAVTTGPGRPDRTRPGARFFPVTVAVPPLRLHVEDLPALVPFLLARLAPGGHLVCSPEACAAHALPLAGQRRAAGGGAAATCAAPAGRRDPARGPAAGAAPVKPPGAQPPGVDGARRHRAQPRRHPRQQGQAARALGMSRATIYRKIHEYGIVAPG